MYGTTTLMSKRILIVDDEPWVIQMVKTVLEKHGHLLLSASDGQQGLDKALASTPDLIITDVMMPGMNGWELIRALRSHPRMSLIPVIFLTALNSEEDRIQGFRLGADDYLPKPFRFEELDLRVEKALRTSQRLNRQVEEIANKDPATDFSGDLSQLGVCAILTTLDLEQKSGILVLKRDRQTVRIFLRDGKAITAAIDGQAQPRGAEVVYHLLTWHSGTFSFSSVDVEMKDEIGCSTTHLLLEGSKLLDES